MERLGADTWNQHRDWYLARLSEFYEGGADSFGLTGPTRAELLEAELWFLLDCPLDTGETPMRGLRAVQMNRAVELLDRSELRAWRIESVPGPGAAVGLCPLWHGRARLELGREPEGVLRPGALVVARSVPVGPERWTLLGRPWVVEPSAMADFEALLASLDAPRGEFWRVHGGVLGRAARELSELRSPGARQAAPRRPTSSAPWRASDPPGRTRQAG